MLPIKIFNKIVQTIFNQSEERRERERYSEDIYKNIENHSLLRFKFYYSIGILHN